MYVFLVECVSDFICGSCTYSWSDYFICNIQRIRYFSDMLTRFCFFFKWNWKLFEDFPNCFPIHPLNGWMGCNPEWAVLHHGELHDVNLKLEMYVVTQDRTLFGVSNIHMFSTIWGNVFCCYVFCAGYQVYAAYLLTMPF